MKLAFVSIETTGLQIPFSAIWEITIITEDERIYTSLIDPGNYEIDSYSKERIPANIHEAPNPDRVTNEIKEFLGEPHFMVAYPGDWTRRNIQELFHRGSGFMHQAFVYKEIDLMQVFLYKFRDQLTTETSLTFNDICAYLGIEPQKPVALFEIHQKFVNLENERIPNGT